MYRCVCLCPESTRGGGGISLPHSGPWHKMEITGQLHAPADLPRRKFPQGWTGCLEEERNLLVLPVIEIRFLWCTDRILLIVMTVTSRVKYKKFSKVYKSKISLVFLGTFFFMKSDTSRKPLT